MGSAIWEITISGPERNEDNNVGVFSLTLTALDTSESAAAENKVLKVGVNIDVIDISPEWHVIPGFNDIYLPITGGLEVLSSEQ
ncbi:hypothetical Protein YC6258_04623 [Gynuella sunshinyii YC6258]|uniref:Uncharacterized protein n=1 Tax=Gynuella sunshinyii YC6258 TaxID=1445510 RepID=A0A0C5VBC8_9GAMM|nr:hypothetical Protein YC6258_04623 [Gynuella sunshinyii YC6258]